MMSFHWGMGGFWLPPLPALLALGVWGLGRFFRARAGQGRAGVHEPPIRDRILKLALRHGGILTVTEVSAETGLSFEKAEEALTGMVDSMRVSMRVDDSGVIFYEFGEILAKGPKVPKALR